MAWEKPTFVEIDMNAEVGSYQDDFGDDPPFVGAPDGDEQEQARARERREPGAG